MDTQTWGPLIGVVVGAVLGGGAQIVDSHLSGRRNRESVRREFRRSVYVEFLRSCTLVHHDSLIVHGPGPGAGRGLSDIVGSLTKMQTARAELTLVAPADTAKAGQALADIHLDIASPRADREALRAKASAARDLFLVYAQRDLGFGMGFRRRTLKERLGDRRKKGFSRSTLKERPETTE